MIVTIDGPAGAGKSTVAKRLASRLGFGYLDTGAMYRAVALAGERAGVDWSNDADIVRLTETADIRWRGDRIFLDGEDVSGPVRSNEITAAVGRAADHPLVRQHLVALQRIAAEGVSLVTEGRDQGSVVFPDAACKIFLDAAAEERARRRVEDFRARGEKVDFASVLADINRRDREDRSRPVGPLVKPADAVTVNTDGLTIDEVVDQLQRIARSRLASEQS